MNLYRVNYYPNANGVPKTSFVVATDGNSASAFLGVRDGQATATMIAENVEVVGLDAAHPAIASLAVNVAPYDAPKQFNQTEMAKIRELLSNPEVQAILAKQEQES